MAVELWAAGAVASWLKFTSQWTDISAFMQSKAQLLRACTLADSKFLADFVCLHDELIPLLPDSELFMHQSSTSTVVARMRNFCSFVHWTYCAAISGNPTRVQKERIGLCMK
jgi:hypothetical protein